MPATVLEPTLSREALIRVIRDTIPPPNNPEARAEYDRILDEWLSRPEWERHVLGFGELWMGHDPSLGF